MVAVEFHHVYQTPTKMLASTMNLRFDKTENCTNDRTNCCDVAEWRQCTREIRISVPRNCSKHSHFENSKSTVRPPETILPNWLQCNGYNNTTSKDFSCDPYNFQSCRIAHPAGLGLGTIDQQHLPSCADALVGLPKPLGPENRQHCTMALACTPST